MDKQSSFLELHCDKLTTIALTLKSITSWRDGTMFLKNAKLSKTDLQQLAHKLDIPIKKRDTIAQLIERIIDHEIVFRTIVVYWPKP